MTKPLTYLHLLVLTAHLAVLSLLLLPLTAHAAIAFVQTNSAASRSGTSISATFGAATTSGNLLVMICGADTGTISTPTGFSTAINQTGTPAQAIFYKISDGSETTLTCTFSSGNNGIQIYEYSGIDTTTPLLGTPGSSTGTSASPASGSTTTTVANALLVAGVNIDGQTAFSAWSNSFTERNDIAVGNGPGNQRRTYGGADRIVAATGTYTTTATAGASNTWRGQIVAFRESTIVPVLSVDIVDATGTSVASPSVSMTGSPYNFDCHAATGTFGVSAQRIRVKNTTATATWTISIAATAGATGSWSAGVPTYDFNDATGGGCTDGGDADTRKGQLSLDPSGGTITPQSGCTTTGLTRGSSTAFVEGTTNSITLLNASSSAGTNCYWDFTNVTASQMIPAEQTVGSYTLNMTLTIVAT